MSGGRWSVGCLLPPRARRPRGLGALVRAYARAAAREGLALIPFTVRDVDRRAGTVRPWPRRRQEALPLPAVVDNRAVHRRRPDIRRLRALGDRPGVTLLNRANRFDPALVFGILESLPACRPFLPARVDPAEAVHRLDAGTPLLVVGPGGRPDRDVRVEPFRRGYVLLRSGPLRRALPRSRLQEWLMLLGPRPPVVLALDGGLPAGGEPAAWHVLAQRDGEGVWRIAGERSTEPGAEADPEARATAVALLGEGLNRFLPWLASVEWRFWVGRDGEPRLVGMRGADLGRFGPRGWGDEAWTRVAGWSAAWLRTLLHRAAGRP